jgi:branched-chain amino acid transport system substrate-binding protein
MRRWKVDRKTKGEKMPLCILVSVLVVLLGCPFFSPGSAEAQVAGKEILIGGPFGMTGIWRDWTLKNMIAVQIATEEINAAGGIMGLPVRMITYDTASKPPEAARVMRKLAEDDKVLAMIGPWSSGEAEVAFPVINKIGVVSISQASSKPGLAKNHRPYAYRNTVDEIKMARVAIKTFMEKNKVKKVVVVHDIKEAVALDLGTKVLPAVFKSLGATIVNEGAYITYTTSDFDVRPQVTKLKGMDFDGIAFGGLYFDAVTFLKEMRRQGLKQNLVGGSPLINEYLPKKGGEDTEGTFAPCTFHYSIAPQKFVDEFIKRAKAKNFDPPEPIMYDANVYDSIYFFKYVVETMGVTNKPEDLAKDREKIMKGFATLKDFKGIVGPTSFNEEGDADKPIFAAEIKGGKWFLNR